MVIKLCEVEGCGKPVYGIGARGADESITRYCRTHYRRLKETGTTAGTNRAKGSLKERFLAKIEKTDSCWIWKGPKNAKGYGVISGEQEQMNVRAKILLAHRVSYELHTGEKLNGKDDVICHSCDNPSCVNPAHLRRDTQSANIKEAFEKQRKEPLILKGEENPKSKLTLEQVKFIKAHPELGHKEIADMFGLSPNCIRGVRIGRTWKHV